MVAVSGREQLEELRRRLREAERALSLVRTQMLVVDRDAEAEEVRRMTRRVGEMFRGARE